MIILLLVGVCANVCFSGLMEEMQALDKEIEKDHKKSLDLASKFNKVNDNVIPVKRESEDSQIENLSTAELIQELKKEINSVNDKGAYHDTHKQTFDEILKKADKENKRNSDNNAAAEEATLSSDEDEFWKKSVDAMFEDIESNEPVVPKACLDTRPDCLDMKEYCVHKFYKESMRKRCPKTCDFCPCEDKFSKCEQFFKLNLCESPDANLRSRTIKYCPKTCGVCKQQAPPKCSTSEFGCCWDKETTKTDKDGKNCPGCKDAYKYVCKKFKDDCSAMNKAGEFMNRYCPEECNRCSGECNDSIEKAFYCPFWKKDLKWCELKKGIMRHYCPKTCEYC